MFKATASLETDRASRYLQAMCKHFAHKIEVDFDAERGSAKMPDGQLTMAASENDLSFVIEAETLQQLIKTRYVVDAHIVRFAFREKLLGLMWHSEELPDEEA